jgi:hypothetical protein
MKGEYDVFEKFPDGPSLWRDSVPGTETTRLRLKELAQKSENQFYAINLTTRKVLALETECNAPGFSSHSRTERRGKSQAAQEVTHSTGTNDRVY